MWDFFLDADFRHALVPGLAVLLAWLADLSFGEPRDALHPVAWFGRLAWPLGCRLRVLAPGLALVAGAMAWIGMASLLGIGAWALESAVYQLPAWLSVPVMACLLKPMFAWRMLRDEVAAVGRSLPMSRPDLAAARERLSPLVSRDISALSPTALREAAIETLAESLCDSLVAPLLWFALAGLPGAVVYRMANTLDALWGYRGPWEWAGKWAARADDVLSWVPARLTALLLRPTLSPSAWAALYRHARRTPSPNAGWPMGAMALHLRVRLGRPGAYVLNENAQAAQARHLALALKRAGVAAWSMSLIAATVSIAVACWA